MNEHQTTRSHYPLLVILAVGLVVRVSLWMWFGGQPLRTVDERHYNAIAVNLVESGDFADELGELTSIRPPLYPAFLALIYQVAGVENFPAVRVVQIVISCLTVCIVYWLGQEMYELRVATCAAAAVCLYPSLVGFGNMLLTETLFVCLLCGACLCLARYFRTEHLGYLMAFGAGLGLAALTRSVLWLFPPFLFVFMLLAVGRQAAWSKRILVAITPIAVFSLVVFPWAVRNTRLQDTFTVIDCMGGRNFMMGNYEHTPDDRIWDVIVDIKGDLAWSSVLARQHDGFEDMTQGQKDKLALRHGLRYVVTHPLITARRCVIKFANFWQLERTLVAGIHRGYWGDVPRFVLLMTAAIVVGSYVAAMLLAVFGYIVTPSDNVRMHCFLLLLVAFVCAVHTVVFGHSRYHLALMPLVLIFSAAGAMQLPSIWSMRRERRFWLAALVATLLVATWAWEIVALAIFGI